MQEELLLLSQLVLEEFLLRLHSLWGNKREEAEPRGEGYRPMVFLWQNAAMSESHRESLEGKDQYAGRGEELQLLRSRYFPAAARAPENPKTT